MEAEPQRYDIEIQGRKTQLLVHNLTEAASGSYFCSAVYPIGITLGHVELKVSATQLYMVHLNHVQTNVIIEMSFFCSCVLLFPEGHHVPRASEALRGHCRRGDCAGRRHSALREESLQESVLSRYFSVTRANCPYRFCLIVCIKNASHI